MKGRVVFLFTLALAAFMIPAAAATAVENGCTPPGDGGTQTSAEPGQNLAEAVGAQESELVGELDDRGFETRLSNAETDEERAEVIAAEVEAITGHLTDLEERCQELMTARSNENISESAYQTRIGRLAIQVRAVDCRINRTEQEAMTLPDTLRAEYNVTESTFASLESRIDELNATVAGDATMAGVVRLGSSNATLQGEMNSCGVEEVTDDESGFVF